jgi:hypothetical protein
MIDGIVQHFRKAILANVGDIFRKINNMRQDLTLPNRIFG